MTIPAVGPITALTWVLEVGDVKRFSSIKKAISYCGLCGAEKSSADTIKRTPISKQRNKHLQSVLVEAARMAPRLSPELALIHDREKQKGNANRATLAVARKLVAYLVAIVSRCTRSANSESRWSDRTRADSVFCRRTSVSRHSRSSGLSPSLMSGLVARSSLK
jgi:Transposase IS116/IS110/IS902 family